MPAGVSWKRYLTVTAAAVFSMLLGSQFTHSIYKPLAGFQEKVEIRKAEIRAMQAKEEEIEG